MCFLSGCPDNSAAAGGSPAGQPARAQVSTGEHTAAPAVPAAPALRYLCMFELQLGQLHQVLPEC